MIVTLQIDIAHFIIFQKIQIFLSQNNSVKNKVNQDLKNLANHLNTNKNCLNISKTKVVLFKSAREQAYVLLKLKHNGKALYTINSARFLGIKTNEIFNLKQEISHLAIFFNSANAILSKLRHFIDRKKI